MNAKPRTTIKHMLAAAAATAALGAATASATETKFLGTQPTTDTLVIRGSAAYRERMALAPGATLLAKLDTSDTTPAEITSATINIAGQVPISFELLVPANSPAAHTTGTVSAAIVIDGTTLFETAEPAQVNPSQPPQPVLLMLRRSSNTE